MNQTQAEQCPGSRREWVKKNGVMTCQGCPQTWDLWRETEPREDGGMTVPFHGRRICTNTKAKKKKITKRVAKSPIDETVSPYADAVARMQEAIDRTYPQRFVMGINIDEVVADRADAVRADAVRRERARPTISVVDEAPFWNGGTVPTVPFHAEEVTGGGYARQSFTTATTASAGPFPSATTHPADCPFCHGRDA